MYKHIEKEEKKLTDEELDKLIKALEYQSWSQNLFELSQASYMLKYQKAEIERLKIDLANEKNWGKIQTKQAVKDTAKEILDGLRNLFIENSAYGCDTNQHSGYYDYSIKMNEVVEWIDDFAKEKYGIEYGVEVD